MELTSVLTLYVGIVSLCSQGYAFGDAEVKFVRHACMYKHHYIAHQYNPRDECKRLTCFVPERMLTIEECAGDDSYNSSCSAELRGKDMGRFPFCCKSLICRKNQTIIKGNITYYMSDGGPVFSDNVFYVKPTGKWSASTQYIFGTCENEKCWYEGQRIIRETRLTTPCVSARTYGKKTYVRVQWCPIFPESKLTNCTKLNDGNKTDRYPYCCPSYMCPPGGRERRNSTELVYAQRHKNKCKYGGTAFEVSFSSYQPCRTAICHFNERTIEDVTCLHGEDLNWTRCIAVAPLTKRYSNHPVCCPDYLCPAMKVRPLPAPVTFDAEVTVDVCKFKTRYFRKVLSISNPCEQYSCDAKGRKVQLYSCETLNETVDEGCTLEVKNPQKAYPDCCKRKVCRHYYSTLFPGSYIAPSPLKEIY
uniref:8.9 kDa family member n=1 Tax=Rhipicephalus zambeziensis TaxID=60191 RepID=A0A224YC36_9ACAR